MTPTSAPATTVAKTSPAANSEKIATQIAGGKLASPESVATSVKSMKPASASSETMTPEKMAPDTTNTAAPPKSSDLGFGSKEALTKDNETAKKNRDQFANPKIRPMQESVTVGDNKYRIV